MKIKVSQATNVQLDFMVGTIEHSLGFEYRPRTKKCYAYDERKLMKVYSPTTSWAQGGELIEREEICIKRQKPCSIGYEWNAWIWTKHIAKGGSSAGGSGPTPLIAAMRCFVASKLGEEVEVPEELAC